MRAKVAESHPDMNPNATKNSGASKAEDIEDTPQWGVWLAHPLLGKVWALGGELCEHNTYAKRR